MSTAVENNGIKGPIQITDFGNSSQLSRSDQEALSSTGISITHIPHGRLEDPYAVTEQLGCSDDSSDAELSSDSKFHPVPKPVLKRIQHRVTSYPKRLSIKRIFDFILVRI
ncbi:hypothetical protein Nepgr_016797 [Nepenthes gracilis]|uniref:Uncharacterized protein n=1 Tax=Nepenthes gracilis TaxID=150966 RepID=A0AAD3XSP3_NEPGR|nr:hypothetical protein Nepgr_016797 [Nepenthes gracilis]